MRRVFGKAALCVAAVLYSVSIAAAEGQPGADRQRAFIDKHEPQMARSSAAAALLHKAADEGEVRVIVGLRTLLPADPDASEAEAARQVQALRSAQDLIATRAGVPRGDVTNFDFIPFVSLWVNAAQLQRLLADPSVLTIQEDKPGDAGLVQSVPHIGAPKLWQRGITGAGWTVAVLDSGVDTSHRMFNGKIVSEACFSTSKGRFSSFCPGGKRESTKRGSGDNCEPASLGQCFHGTHVAGITAGVAGNLKGVARGSKIIAIQVFSKDGDKTVTFDTDWIKGLERVFALRKRFNIAAVNMSLGFGQFPTICDQQNQAAAATIKKLREAGIATIVASMNDSLTGATRAPACISSAIAVGATGRSSDGIAGFSNHLPLIRHMAPGVDIVSAFPNNNFKALSGTSMAAPHVAGAYALLKDLRPKSSVSDLVAALACTGKAVARAGIVERRIDLVEARQYLLDPPRKQKDFQFTNDAPGWVADRGPWALGSGFLHTNDVSGGFYAVTMNHCNESMDIEARVQRLAAADAINGFLFKSQFVQTGEGLKVSGYFAGYNAQSGGGLLMRFDHYNLTTNTGQFKTLCNRTAALSNDGINRLKLVTRGGNHKLVINGQNVCSATDYGYTTGRAGLIAFMPGVGGDGFGADWFKITPAEAVPRSVAVDELALAAE